MKAIAIMKQSTRSTILTWRSRVEAKYRKGDLVSLTEVVCRKCNIAIQDGEKYVQNGKHFSGGTAHYYHYACAKRINLI